MTVIISSDTACVSRRISTY